MTGPYGAEATRSGGQRGYVGMQDLDFGYSPQTGPQSLTSAGCTRAVPTLITALAHGITLTATACYPNQPWQYQEALRLTPPTRESASF